MNLKIYNNSSDPRATQKSLSLVADLSAVQLTDQTSIENPSFLLDYNSAYINANYAYCPEMKRYYFITGREIRNGNQMILNCHVDVRMSFRSQILASSIIADRSSSAGDPYVPDPMVTVKDSVQTIIRKVSTTPFTGPGGSNNLVLTIGGK